jgi:armadillo repeat-containing protein 6
MRNSISRKRELGDKLIELKVEDLLRTIMNDANLLKCHDSAKTVLRDLGCEVELKELWTGNGLQMNNYD